MIFLPIDTWKEGTKSQLRDGIKTGIQVNLLG